MDEFVQLVSEQAEVVATVGTRFGCRDPKDDAILEVATTAQAPYVVTRDDDLKRDPELLFLAALAASEG